MRHQASGNVGQSTKDRMEPKRDLFYANAQFNRACT